MVTEPTLDDAADYRFDNLYRVNWIEKLPDYQYQCLHLPFYQICDTFGGKNKSEAIGWIRQYAARYGFTSEEIDRYWAVYSLIEDEDYDRYK